MLTANVDNIKSKDIISTLLLLLLVVVVASVVVGTDVVVVPCVEVVGTEVVVVPSDVVKDPPLLHLNNTHMHNAHMVQNKNIKTYKSPLQQQILHSMSVHTGSGPGFSATPS